MADIARTTDEDDARIIAAALADPDAQPLTEKFWTNALPWDQHQKRMRRLRGQRGPQKAPVKKLISLRLDSDLIEHFRATGAGWQSRINALLRKAAGLK